MYSCIFCLLQKKKLQVKVWKHFAVPQERTAMEEGYCVQQLKGYTTAKHCNVKIKYVTLGKDDLISMI